MEDKIDIKFTKNHYVYESDSLIEIFAMNIGDKVEFKGHIYVITDATSTNVTLFKSKPNLKSDSYEIITYDEIRLINLHVIDKEYTISKTNTFTEKESKNITFNSIEAADIYKHLKSIKDLYKAVNKAVNYDEWFDRLEDFIYKEELY